MKQVLALGMVAMALAAGAVGAAGGTNPNTLTFAVYGDSPYGEAVRTASRIFEVHAFASSGHGRTLPADADAQ